MGQATYIHSLSFIVAVGQVFSSHFPLYLLSRQFFAICLAVLALFCSVSSLEIAPGILVVVNNFASSKDSMNSVSMQSGHLSI